MPRIPFQTQISPSHPIFHLTLLIMPSTCSPVVNIPVITGFINQAIVEVQLFLCHVVQMCLSKEARNKKEKEVEKPASGQREVLSRLLSPYLRRMQFSSIPLFLLS